MISSSCYQESLGEAATALPPSGGLQLYRQNRQNTCPGCGKSHWLIGRSVAQCAFCETALPLAQGWRFEGLTISKR